MILKGLFHPACLARVVSWFAFVDAIFMAYENGHKQRPVKGQHVQGMLDETDPLSYADDDHHHFRLQSPLCNLRRGFHVSQKESNPLPSRSLKQLINVLSLLIGTEIKKAHIKRIQDRSFPRSYSII